MLDRPAEPLLVEVTVDDAIQRIADGLLRAAHPYVVQRVAMDGGVVTNLLVISEQELDATRGGLVGAHAESARATINAEHEARIRDEVVAELEAAGVIPTQEQWMPKWRVVLRRSSPRTSRRTRQGSSSAISRRRSSLCCGSRSPQTASAISRNTAS